jgi:hypothetical protein
MWCENKDIEIYSAADTADSSAIKPESYDRVYVQRAVTLDSFTSLMGLGRIKLVKCDAEGAEPEVMRGARETFRRTEYVAFDCGPERQGQPTYRECAAILREYGFEVIEAKPRNRQILFGRNRAFV